MHDRADVLIGVDTKYWMNVNGSLAVCEGGLFRESLHGCGYADRVDVASHLKKGRNVIAILVWYYGNSGRNNIDSTRAGMIMECGSLGIFSDENFLCMRHPGYGTVEGHSPSRLYGGDDICYRAGTICDGFEQPDFDEYVCMRDNFMDCPDRERGQWIGDLSVQVPQVMFLLSPSARKLVKKSIYDFINLRQGDVLVGNVPGAHCGEMSAQILNAISEWGLLAQYYHYTSDKKTLLQAFEPVVRYLQLWQVKEDGTITRGNDTSGWHIWYDHLYNQDIPVLRNAWYYSALSFAQTMASLLDDHRFDDFLSQRKDILSAAFEKNFWNGRFYASGNFVDDRANAMAAVLSGLCPKERYPNIRDILLSVFNSTVYMENYILTALCEMGYYEEAYRRMMSRYYNLASNENSTLWEDFFIQGTKNHAWSGAPATIAFRYFLGLDSTDGFRTFTVNPVSGLFDHMEASFMTKQGPVKVSYHNGKTEIHYQKTKANTPKETAKTPIAIAKRPLLPVSGCTFSSGCCSSARFS